MRRWVAFVQFGSAELHLGEYTADTHAEALEQARRRLQSATVGVRPDRREAPRYDERERVLSNKGGFRQGIEAVRKSRFGRE